MINFFEVFIYLRKGIKFNTIEITTPSGDRYLPIQLQCSSYTTEPRMQFDHKSCHERVASILNYVASGVTASMITWN